MPGEERKFLIKRHELLYTEVTASNLVKVSMDDDLDESAGVNRPGFTLHGGVLSARPDVNCAVHVHTELGMALATRPRILLLDEVAAGLTEAEAEGMARLVRRCRDELGLAVVWIEHAVAILLRAVERVVVLHQGRKLAEGPPQTVARDPAVIEALRIEVSERARRLVGPGADVTRPEGSAHIDRFFVTLQVVRSFRVGRSIEPSVGLGGGLQDVSVHGISAMPSPSASLFSCRASYASTQSAPSCATKRREWVGQPRVRACSVVTT